MSDLKRSRSETSPENGKSGGNPSSLKRNRSEDSAGAPNKAGSRRMFGALMGHLGRARQNLKEDADVIEKQISRQQEATQKNTEESKRVAKLQRTLSVEQKEKELNLRDSMLLKRLRARLESTSSAWKKRQTSLQPYLVTATEPCLAWLPKTHNEVTQSQLDQRAAVLEESFLRRDEADAAEVKAKEESMAATRQAILESLRLKNAEWEARQVEVAALCVTGSSGSQEGKKARGGDDDGDGDDDFHDDDRDENGDVEDEEEEEEDILAALDGKKKLAPQVTAPDTNCVTVDEVELEKQGEDHMEVDGSVDNADLGSDVKDEKEAVPVLSVEEDKEEKEEPTSSNVTEGTTDNLESNDTSSSSHADVTAPAAFNEESEMKQLSCLTVSQLKALAKEEGVELRKGRMLKKDYVEDVCKARKRNSL